MSDSDLTGDAPETTTDPSADAEVSYPLRPALEAILMVADQPLDHLLLASAVAHPPAQVEIALVELARSYDDEDRGFELRQVAGGWRFYTRSEYAGAVERFVLEGQQARLTQAALETMAVVAYRQPVSRARVSAIRGVNVDGVMRTLVTRGLVAEAGTDVETGAVLYATTPYFLERMGLSSLDDLPDLAPFLPDMDDVDDPEVVAAPEPAAPEPSEPSEPASADDVQAADPTADPTADAPADRAPDEEQA
ncbi:SMC-Scp complex subunit ScpB [Mumia zhuanghuii]|uniref:SMC-Scp complex subunit ScpB n=2 Tax=Mumia TaxID=1546255 RepID=A0ABW1QN42_9ACTN|nr:MULTISPECIES: SMC-Scp complex subunit ScpB [Mumia]KAA1419734.1 SMC-Scp complex subunit ScpB [Mumia zhuanghuii]